MFMNKKKVNWQKRFLEFLRDLRLLAEEIYDEMIEDAAGREES